MPRNLALLLASAAIFALAIAPSALAASVGGGVAVDRSARAAAEFGTTARTATTLTDDCRSQIGADAPAAAQIEAMLCLTNTTRARHGLQPLEATTALTDSAAAKARDVLDCDEFSHQACGRTFSHWMGEVGYLASECWRVGENLAWGVDEQGSVASMFRAWMRSPTHRENILGDYDQVGIALDLGSLGSIGGAHMWAQHFGSQRCRA
jgi:uncharacterized protein YkwD